MSDEKVVKRIKAGSSKKTPKKTVKTDKSTKMTKVEKSAVKKIQKTPKKAKITKKSDKKVGYLRGSFHELRQVHWTNRSESWKLTIAVILFCAFFATFILAFDNIFNWVVEQIFN